MASHCLFILLTSFWHWHIPTWNIDWLCALKDSKSHRAWNRTTRICLYENFNYSLQPSLSPTAHSLVWRLWCWRLSHFLHTLIRSQMFRSAQNTGSTADKDLRDLQTPSILSEWFAGIFKLRTLLPACPLCVLAKFLGFEHFLHVHKKKLISLLCIACCAQALGGRFIVNQARDFLNDCLTNIGGLARL